MVVFLPLLTWWYLLQNIQRFFFVWIFWKSPHDDQLLLMHLILPKISTESDFLWWKEHKGSPKRVGKKIWFGTFNCINYLWINIYLSRCKFLFNDIFVLRKIQGLETVKIWLLRSRDNSKQDGKSLCSMLSSIFFWKHNSLLSCRSKSTFRSWSLCPFIVTHK